VQNFKAEKSVQRIVKEVADPQQQELLTTVSSWKTRSATTEGLQSINCNTELNLSHGGLISIIQDFRFKKMRACWVPEALMEDRDKH
jgi:hypothetical protein